jgi:hypothetical protein
MKSGNDKIS